MEAGVRVGRGVRIGRGVRVGDWVRIGDGVGVRVGIGDDGSDVSEGVGVSNPAPALQAEEITSNNETANSMLALRLIAE